MSLNRIIPLVLLLLTWPHGSLIAETSSTPPPKDVDLSQALTLSQCIDLALEYSSVIRNARTNVALSELRVRDAKSLYLPDISVNGRYQFSDQIDFGFDEPNYDASVRGSYTLWDHGQREANLGQAKADAGLSQAQFERMKLNLILDVTRAYYNVLKARKLVEVDEELLKQARDNTARVRALKEHGSLIEADVANAEVSEATSELNLLNDRNALEVALANLPTVLGLDPGTQIEVSDDPDYDVYIQGRPLPTIGLTLEEAIQKAFDQRPEIAETQAQIERLNWSLALARLQRWPRLTATYDYNVFLDDYLREREDFKNYRSWQALATLSFPLFDGGRTQRQVSQLELQQQRELENAASQERAIALEVRQAYLELQRAEKALDIANKRVHSAELNLEVTRARFEFEQAIPLELLDARNNYAQALTARVNAFYDYKIARSQLEKAIGGIQ